MKFSTTIILLLIAAALGAYVYFVDYSQPTTLELNTESPLRFAVEDARVITIARSGEAVALKRTEDGRWFLLQPVEDRANQEICAAFLESLNTLTVREVIHSSEIESGSVALADLGLNPEKRTGLVVLGTGGPIASVSIGNAGALENTTYVTFPENPHFPHVYLVDANLNEFSARGITALRDPDVLPFAPERIGRLLFRNGESQVEIYYDTRLAIWKIGEPLQSRADQKRVEEIVDQLCALEIVGFEETSEEIAPTIAGRQSISVWTLDPETGIVPAPDTDPAMVIDIATGPVGPPPSSESPTPPSADPPAGAAAEKSHILAKVSDRESVLRVPPELADILATSPNALRDPFLARIPEKEVRGIIVQTADNPDVILTNNGRRWISLRNGSWEPANGIAITRLLRSLNKEKVLDFVADTSANLADFDLAPPAVRLGITTSRKVMTPGTGDDPPPVPVPVPGVSTEAPSLSSANTSDDDPDDPDAFNYVIGFGRVPGSGQDDDPDRLYATFADEPFVVSIDPAFLNAIPLHPLGWKDPSVLSFSIVSLRKIRLHRPGEESDDITLGYDPFAGAWTYARGDTDHTAELDREKAHALAESLSTLAARDWLANREAAYRALEEPAAVIDLTLSFLSEDGNEDVEKRTTLTFAPVRASDPADPTHFHYARIDTSPEVFLIENKTLHNLFAPLTK